MAKHNPFSIFRRNQKVWMAGLTLFTMFSFIALGSMLQCVGARNEGNGPRYTGQVAKTQAFGVLDYNDFLTIRQDMFRLGAFLDTIAAAAQEIQAQPSDTLTALRMETNIATADAEILVDRWLVTQTALKEGAKPSDAAALEYLRNLTQAVQVAKDGSQTVGSIPTQSLQIAMQRAGLTDSGLRDLLKNQIAYERKIREADSGRRMDAWYNQSGVAQMAYGHGELLAAPADALAAYNALNQMAKAKVAVFKASDYADEIKDPSEAQTKAFYEQYKDVVFHADSETPGFTQPTKLALEVVRADIDDAVLDSIPMEEVEKFYEEHKEEYRIPSRSKAAAEEAPAAESLSLPGADAPALNAISDDAINAFGADEEAAPAVEEAAAPAEEAAPAADESAYLKSETDAVYAQEAEEAAAEEAAPVAEEAAPVAEEAAPVAEEAAAEEAAPVAEEAAAEEESEYLPLADVERFIRTQIAAERIEAKMAELQKELQAYYRETVAEKANVTPVNVDMKKFAEDNGLKYVKTERAGESTGFAALVSQDEASIMDVLPADTLQQIYQSTPLVNSAQRVGVYDPENNPMQRFDPPTVFYVFRATETKNQYRPEYDEAKDDVVKAYKLAEAARIADAKAKEFAEKAKAEGADFDALAAEAKAAVVETEKFSWFKSSLRGYGSYAQPSEILEAGVEAGQADRDNKEIVAPGWKFYETVFALDQDAVGCCQNQSKDRAFVVKVVEKDAPEMENLEQIQSDQSLAYVAMWFRRARLEEFHQDLMKQLREKAGFEWIWIPRVEEER